MTRTGMPEEVVVVLKWEMRRALLPDPERRRATCCHGNKKGERPHMRVEESERVERVEEVME